MKPRSKTETRHAATSGGRAKRAYYPGSKPFMKQKQGKARRRTDRAELDPRTVINPLTGHTETWVGDTQCWPQD